MEINWRVRIKSKTFWVGISSVILAFIFKLLGEFGIQTSITEGMISDLIMLILTVLGGLGVITDPTTKGINDSEKAMQYIEPR